MTAERPASPALARRLVALVAPRAERAFVIGDMEEEFAERVRTHGASAARRWYWKQTMASLTPLARMRLRSTDRERGREWRGDPMWRDVIDDLRYAVRVGRRNPLLSAAVTATMVLGIAVTTAVFTVVNGVLLRPLPFPHSERVVRIGVILRNGVQSNGMAWPDLQDYKRDQGMLVLLGAAVAAVLLIASGNIANLLLGHSQARSREFAVRSALGGSQGRIRRQLLTESVLLSLAGGGLGMALAPLVTRMLIALYPGGLPRVGEVHIDATVLAAALAATALAGLLSGVPMARRAAALDLTRDLRDGGRSSGGRGHRRFSDGLVVSQIAISVTLLFAAGLLIETFWRLTHEDPGFAPNGVVTFQLTASTARFPSDDNVRSFYASLTESIGAIPGVRSVGTTTQLPFGGGVVEDVCEREGKGDHSPSLPMAIVVFASPSYHGALGIHIVRGRGFEPSDDAGGARVVVIDESLAKREYPGEDPIGRVILWNDMRCTIVGVARGVRIFNLWEEPSPELYFSTNQLQSRSQYIVIKSDVPRAQLLRAVRRELRRLNPTAAITDIKSMNERLAISLAAQRYRAVLIAALGAVALALSLVGIYGVVSYAVSRQTREIGIRMALGENAARIRWRVVLNALTLAAVGTAVGVALSFGAGKWLASFLVGVNPHDARMLAAVGATLLFVALMAAYLPARRASLVDPSIALRGD